MGGRTYFFCKWRLKILSVANLRYQGSTIVSYDFIAVGNFPFTQYNTSFKVNLNLRPKSIYKVVLWSSWHFSLKVHILKLKFSSFENFLFSNRHFSRLSFYLFDVYNRACSIFNKKTLVEYFYSQLCVKLGRLFIMCKITK